VHQHRLAQNSELSFPGYAGYVGKSLIGPGHDYNSAAGKAYAEAFRLGMIEDIQKRSTIRSRVPQRAEKTPKGFVSVMTEFLEAGS
jgi:hypothetical protein